MMRTSEITSPSKRFLAIATVAILSTAACADAESREAPDQEAAPMEQATSMDEDTVASDASSDDVATSPSSDDGPIVPQGSTMTFTVDQDISTDSHAEGDRFLAQLQSPVTTRDGDVGLAAGTPSQWVVTRSTTEDGQALLAVELESIEVDGEWMPVKAKVDQLDLDTDTPDSGGETGAKIGIGAAAGALIGQILGKDTESTLKGAGVGAAVGTAVALATKGGSATIPAGSTLMVTLDESLTVS